MTWSDRDDHDAQRLAALPEDVLGDVRARARMARKIVELKSIVARLALIAESHECSAADAGVVCDRRIDHTGDHCGSTPAGHTRIW